MTIINNDSSIISKGSSKLIDDTRGVINDCRMFIIEANGLLPKIFLQPIGQKITKTIKSIIDCLMAHTAYLVFFISTVDGQNKNSHGRLALVEGT